MPPLTKSEKTMYMIFDCMKEHGQFRIVKREWIAVVICFIMNWCSDKWYMDYDKIWK